MFIAMMKIKTDCPIIDNREYITQQIANFWDKLSEGWRIVWGEHIHHGYYDETQHLTPNQAQEKLIEKLANLLPISPGDIILDAGCGMGGSSLYLGKHYHAQVTGITLSPNQAAIALNEARQRNIVNVNFKVEDALILSSMKEHAFDIVWSLESCEQMFDKALFIKQAFRVLKPGGKFMLATWCSDQDEYEDRLAKQYKKLCLAFDLPYMPTIAWYRKLLTQQGFIVSTVCDWSPFVKKSWEVGISLANTFSFLQILRMAGWRGWRFTQQAKLMRDAFKQGRVCYGVFIATKCK